MPIGQLSDGSPFAAYIITRKGSEDTMIGIMLVAVLFVDWVLIGLQGCHGGGASTQTCSCGSTLIAKLLPVVCFAFMDK